MGIGTRLFICCCCGALTFQPIARAANPSYTIQTVAGSDFTGDGGPATQAILSQTEGVAVDPFGNIYVADADDNRVRKISVDGTIQTVAGNSVAGFSGDGGKASAGLLSHPYGLALDAAGNLYVADLGNARIRKISLDGIIQTVAGGGMVAPGVNGDGSPAVSMQLNSPRNVALDPDGTMYISDFGAHRVYRVSSSGIFTTLAGTGKAGFSGDNAASSLAQLNSPAGISSDGNGSLYIADSGNNRVRKVFRGVITTVYNITGPTGLAFSPSGTLYMAGANYVGTSFHSIGGLASALDVTLDAAGNVFVTTGQQVRKVTADGKVSTVAGSGTLRYFGGDNGLAVNARMHAPSGLAVDDAGNWYIADTANNRIRKINSAGMITTIAGTGVPGSSGDNGPATVAQLSAPRSVATDSQHNLYIADTGNNRVRKITPGGILATVVGGLNDPEYVAVDRDGALYVADAGNNRVIRVAPSGTTSLVAQVEKPSAVTVDSAGNIFISEATRVSKVTPAGAVTVVLDGLNQPRGLAIADNGDVLIAEPNLNVIHRLSASGLLTIIAGTGAPGFSGDGGSAATAQLNGPSDIVADLTGTLWITDSGNNRIRTLSPTIAADIVANVTLVNAASLVSGPIAPGEIVSIFGTGFVPGQTQLLFDQTAATIFYTGTNQINALVPSNLPPNSNTQISVTVNDALAGGAVAPVVSASPGIFTVANGTGQAAAVNEDGSSNSSANPALRGSVIVLYGTGQGQNPDSVGVTIGGYTAELLYAGPAPGFPGLMQINARVPGGFAPVGILPVVLTVGTAAAQAGVTIAVR